MLPQSNVSFFELNTDYVVAKVEVFNSLVAENSKSLIVSVLQFPYFSIYGFT